MIWCTHQSCCCQLYVENGAHFLPWQAHPTECCQMYSLARMVEFSLITTPIFFTNPYRWLMMLDHMNLRGQSGQSNTKSFFWWEGALVNLAHLLSHLFCCLWSILDSGIVIPPCGWLKVGAEPPVATSGNEKLTPAVEPICKCVIESPPKVWLQTVAVKGKSKSMAMGDEWSMLLFGIAWAMSGDDGCIVHSAKKA
jgi:hypothetical protein